MGGRKGRVRLSAWISHVPQLQQSAVQPRLVCRTAKERARARRARTPRAGSPALSVVPSATSLGIAPSVKGRDYAMSTTQVGPYGLTFSALVMFCILWLFWRGGRPRSAVIGGQLVIYCGGGTFVKLPAIAGLGA